MQDITKTCDYCKATEVLKKTIENPKPKSKFQTIKIGTGEQVMIFDLCEEHSFKYRVLTKAWLEKQTSLEGFLK